MRKLLLFFLLLPSLLWAQNYELGELIIKLKSNNPETWVQRVSTVNSTPTGLQIKQTVSQPFNIYLFTFNEAFWTERTLIAALKENNLVEEAQINHKITPRLVPNDPLYSSQWQYNNTGQNGGTPGADIDIEGAWEETTGGLTVDGDTIVVCVIDGGFEITHPDLEPNMWKNYAEIAGNGIDDDSNGYVDDFNGWNAYSSNDNIVPNNSHGTPVAAIVGAKGDDGYGVAGVNWNVKIMGISGGGNEAEALAAYTYPYLARKKYNETNGAEGAFVVATNASWGVDYGQAADAPLWCAFYDSLGAVGILNAGATINGNVNVDVQGDLPTQCSSEYLIAVTNMNNQDEKVTGAGYGATSIDMGAFGAGTFTADAGNSHGSFGGTSGATPHVAGTIALLYSAECSSFIEIAKQNPSQAALLIKNYIFEGLDDNTSLQGITTQEGRLNVNNSMQLLLEECSSCPAVTDLTATLTEQNATVSWVDSAGTANRILFKESNSTEWDTISNVTSPYQIDSLNICSTYKIKVQNLCPDTTWATSSTISLETGNCCYVVDFEQAQVTDSEIELEWGATPNANAYTVYYKLEGATNWIDSVLVSGGTTTSVLSDLEACSTYEVKLKSQCPEIGQESVLFIETKGCENCVALEYCDADEFNPNNYITQVKLNDFEKNSMSGLNGYQNFEGTSQFKITRGQGNSVKVTTSSAASAYRARLWVDFNQDGNFDDDEDFGSSQTANTFTFNVTVPDEALNGLTRLRLVYQFPFGNTSLVPCNSTAFFRVGEVEDYCVNIVEPLHVETTNGGDLEMYPNPVLDVLYINNLSDTPYKIQLTDLLGKTVKKELISGTGVSGIDVSDLPSGIYFIEYKNNTKHLLRQKFIKQ